MELKIDDVPLVMGATIDPDRLSDPPFHKVGLIRRFLTGRSIHRVLFTADDARLGCLADDFSIYPCTDSYLDEDRRWNTQASLFLVQDRLEEVVFRVLDARYAAGNFTDRFTELCTAILGDPRPGPNTGTIWHNGNTVVSGTLHPNGHEAEFRFRVKDR